MSTIFLLYYSIINMSYTQGLSTQTLSAPLLAKIQARPTRTYLRTDIQNANIYSSDINVIKNIDRTDGIGVPDNFDGRKVWKDYLSPVKDQGTCSSCWAYSTSSVLADRFNIQSQGVLKLDLSPTKMIICNGYMDSSAHPEKDIEATASKEFDNISNSACYGETLYNAWKELFIVGTNTEECVPYNKNVGRFKKLNTPSAFTTPEKIPVCSQITGILGDMCANYSFNEYTSQETGDPARFYRCLHFYAIAGTSKDNSTEANIRAEIYRFGPATSAMRVYPDFYTFDSKNNIYAWDGKGDPISGHAIEIIGWGTTASNIDYWIIKNSWGDRWGDDGFFKMRRGTNECEIEDNVIACVPDFFYPLTYLPTISYKWSEMSKSIEERKKISNDLTAVAGGIDPLSGYTRRILATKPWVDLTAPIDHTSQLPDFSTWIAGEISQEKNKNISTINTHKKSILPIIVIISCFLAIIVCIIFYQIFYHKISKSD
jgi:C1A family cysteine protease